MAPPARPCELRLEIWFNYSGERAQELEQLNHNRRPNVIRNLAPAIHADMHALALVFPGIDFLFSAHFKDAQIRCYATVRPGDVRETWCEGDDARRD